MVSRASRLARSCNSFAWSMVPQVGSPFHRSPGPKMAAGWVHAVAAFLQLAGERPICPASRRSRAIAFFPFFIRMA